MKISEQETKNKLSQVQLIKDIKYRIEQIDYSVDEIIYTTAISNDVKYIVSGGEDELLKIWDYKTNNLVQSIKFDNIMTSCKFALNSKLLYIGVGSMLYQLCINNNCKKLWKQDIHDESIHNIVCLSNTILLTSSYRTIIQTDICQKVELIKIQAHNNYIFGLDYNINNNVIVSGSDDTSIKLWSGADGTLILAKQNAHNNNCRIQQTLFSINKNQLISLDVEQNLIIWKINYNYQLLEQLQSIKNCGYNISLALQKYIVSIGQKFIKFHTTQGEFIRQIDHDVENVSFYNTIQDNSMKAILIKGIYRLKICKFEEM